MYERNVKLIDKIEVCILLPEQLDSSITKELNQSNWEIIPITEEKSKWLLKKDILHSSELVGIFVKQNPDDYIGDLIHLITILKAQYKFDEKNRTHSLISNEYIKLYFKEDIRIQALEYPAKNWMRYSQSAKQIEYIFKRKQCCFNEMNYIAMVYCIPYILGKQKGGIKAVIRRYKMWGYQVSYNDNAWLALFNVTYDEANYHAHLFIEECGQGNVVDETKRSD